MFSGPIGDRRPEPHIAEAQRKEFFTQLHRWLRQDYAVHLFCNNDGERQRFEEIWREYGLGDPDALAHAPRAPSRADFFLSRPNWRWSRTRKFLAATKCSVRAGSNRPTPSSSHSLLDINFAELAEGDYVVHLQHGIGRYLGLRRLPAALGRKLWPNSRRSRRPARNAWSSNTRRRSAPTRAETLRAGQRVASGQQIRRRGQGASAVEHAGRRRAGPRPRRWPQEAVRDLAGEMLSIQAVRSSQAGPRLSAGHAVAAGI